MVGTIELCQYITWKYYVKPFRCTSVDWRKSKKVNDWKFMRNFLNADGLSPDTPIYSIMQEEHLLNLFKDKKNVLRKPSDWDDPFENFILKSEVQLSSGEKGVFDFHDDFYGQCWTLNKNSDAMWRIYSQGKNGIQVTTTIRKLLKSLHEHLGEDAIGYGFVGRVQYFGDKELVEFGDTVFDSKAKIVNFTPGVTTVNTVRTLFVKRCAFKHEEEVRLIRVSKQQKPTEALYKYPVDPHDFVDQLMLDPRLSEASFEKKKKCLKLLTGFKV